LGEGSAPVTYVTLQPPIELDGLRRDDILALRRDAVNRYDRFLSTPYAPYDEIFREIDDSAPWWGILGHFYYGSGARSIDGPSEEARFLLNPYLLIGADLLGFSIFNGDFFQWNTDIITETDLQDPDFPLFCAPQDLVWTPQERYVEVTFDITACIAALNEWTIHPIDLSESFVYLNAYNARDFNLNYAQVTFPDLNASAVFSIPHMLHRGEGCGYAGGCNNMSPYVAELSDILIPDLPSDLIIRLWSEAPDPATETEDLLYTIHFI
jgi:hypothetical protein